MTDFKSQLTLFISCGTLIGTLGQMSPSRAEVSIRDAAYSHSVPLLPSEPTFRLTYNSRSRHNGMIGFGWCLPFEITLERIDERRLRLRDCIQGDIVYTKGATDQYRQMSRPAERVVTQDSQFTRFLDDGEVQFFSATGRLRRWVRPGFGPLELKYDRAGTLLAIHDGRPLLKFFYEPTTGRLARLLKASGEVSQFRRIGEDLISIADSAGRAHRYQYDDLHNLIHIQFPDRSIELVSYDRDRDRVLEWSERDRCMTRYSYTELRSQNERGQSTTTVTHCPGAPPRQRVYEFWWSRGDDGAYRLQRARDADIETWFDSHHGQPIRLIRAGAKTHHLFYDPQGRLQSVFESDQESLRLIYQDDSRRPAKITSPDLGSIRFHYAPDGTPLAANASGGREALAALTRRLKAIVGPTLGRGRT